MTKLKRVIKKLTLILLVLTMIYFCIGFIAAATMIIIEAATHQMSSEIQQDTPSFEPWLIYLGMFVMMILCFGMALGAYFAHKAIKNIGKPKSLSIKTTETEIY